MLWTENTNFTIKVERLEIMDVKVSDGSFCFRTFSSRFKPSATINTNIFPVKAQSFTVCWVFFVVTF
jgi:hypothetical protein